MFKKPIIIYRSRYLRWMPWNSWVHGMVLYPLVLFRFEQYKVEDRLFRHELQHFYQGQTLGFFGYYWKYVKYLHKSGWKYTKSHPMEAEAETHENDPLTPLERKWKDD